MVAVTGSKKVEAESCCQQARGPELTPGVRHLLHHHGKGRIHRCPSQQKLDAHNEHKPAFKHSLQCTEQEATERKEQEGHSGAKPAPAEVCKCAPHPRSNAAHS